MLSAWTDLRVYESLKVGQGAGNHNILHDRQQKKQENDQWSKDNCLVQLLFGCSTDSSLTTRKKKGQRLVLGS